VPRADRPGPQRSAQKRERERLERERRRAAGALEPATSAARETPPSGDDVPPAGREVEPASDVVPPEWEEDAPHEIDDPQRAWPDDLPPEIDDARRAWPDDLPPQTEGLPPAAADVRVRRRAARVPASRSRRSHSPRARVGAVAALLFAVFALWFGLSLSQPFHGSGSGSVIVVIPKGSSASKIGSILEHDGVVSSGFFFELRALIDGKRSSLHSGRFRMRHDMSYAAAIDALSQPPPAAILVKVVIPEGFTRAQIAQLAGKDEILGSYLAASRGSHELRPSHYGAPAGTAGLEGFLFPATYELAAGAPASRLVAEQLAAFKERYGAHLFARARALGETSYQLLTVASMVEREAQLRADRPRIAAVIYNRLRVGMPLGIDATIYYAVELQRGIATYTGELTASQLRIDSPYNTRTHKGLPPTPISNPGEASIEAAEHPARVPYLYYVAGADGCGEQVFSTTYARFQEDVAAYETAVKRNGGKPPVCGSRR
jgi:UPF0755 protein